MIFSEYLKRLNKFAETHPETLGYQCVSAIDDEGNGFNVVHFSPSVGYFDGSYDFTKEKYISELMDDDDDPEDFKPNAICIN
jgi:hypothetical protein